MGAAVPLERQSFPLPFAPQEQPVYRNLQYGPLPWLTHPIDVVQQQQGWGPLDGPWQHVDFLNPAAPIDITYASGSPYDARDFSPPYQITTLFDDPSENRVNNVFHKLSEAAAGLASDARSRTSTIANAVVPGVGRFRAALGLPSSGGGESA